MQPITFTKSSRVQQFFELGLGSYPKSFQHRGSTCGAWSFLHLFPSPPILISQLCSQFLSLSLCLWSWKQQAAWKIFFQDSQCELYCIGLLKSSEGGAKASGSLQRFIQSRESCPVNLIPGQLPVVATPDASLGSREWMWACVCGLLHARASTHWQCLSNCVSENFPWGDKSLL